MKKNTAKKQVKNAGMTLIEIMVVIGIFTLLASVTLNRTSSFDGNALLTNLAYEVAVTIREVRISSQSVLGQFEGGETEFNAGYGIHTDLANPSQFEVFADSNNNQMFDDGETRNTFTLNRGFQIVSVCGILDDSSSSSINFYCPSDNASATEWSIVYDRPFAKATVSSNSGGGNSFIGIAIYLQSDESENVRRVTAWSSGQIAVSPVSQIP